MDLESSSPQAVPERGPMRYVWTISLIAAMGGLLFGYDFVVIGGAKPFFEKYFQLDSESLSGWANSCALLGCLVGALVSGGLSDKFGRKKLLLVAAFLFASLLGLNRLGADVLLVCRVAPLGRSGHRHDLERRAGLHRRGRAGPSPRPLRGDLPTDHLHWDRRRANRELADRRKDA